MRIANKLHLIATTSLTLTLAAMASQAAAQNALPTGGSGFRLLLGIALQKSLLQDWSLARGESAEDALEILY